ncbi:ester cyclase [Haloferax profundi]|uniref:Ester cyclase n=1 Tax=Haloferax profundi TaxID=1544718 RepID=A0A0W1RLU1_9EURY|nr:ester cyclase [Haloferax profundi]KTG14428.1 hypothetical protein AUR66_03135 [Haloferax profundi]
MAQASTDTEQLLSEYANMWNEREYAKIPDLVSESFVIYDPAAPGGVARGRDGLEQFMRGIVSGFPDFHVTVLDTLSSEDKVMYEGRLSMTHEGEFDGIPPTGKKVELRYMGIIEIADGKVQQHRVYFNQLEALEQLGLTED